MYESVSEYWGYYGQKIIENHPDCKYVALYGARGMDDRFRLFKDESAVRRAFRDFVSVELWKGPPVIKDLDAERRKLGVERKVVTLQS